MKLFSQWISHIKRYLQHLRLKLCLKELKCVNTLSSFFKRTVRKQPKFSVLSNLNLHQHHMACFVQNNTSWKEFHVDIKKRKAINHPLYEMFCSHCHMQFYQLYWSQSTFWISHFRAGNGEHIRLSGLRWALFWSFAFQ